MEEKTYIKIEFDRKIFFGTEIDPSILTGEMKKIEKELAEELRSSILLSLERISIEYFMKYFTKYTTYKV